MASGSLDLQREPCMQYSLSVQGFSFCRLSKTHLFFRIQTQRTAMVSTTSSRPIRIFTIPSEFPIRQVCSCLPNLCCSSHLAIVLSQSSGVTSMPPEKPPPEVSEESGDSGVQDALSLVISQISSGNMTTSRHNLKQVGCQDWNSRLLCAEFRLLFRFKSCCRARSVQENLLGMWTR